MIVDEKLVKHLANLSKLKFTDEEIKQFISEFSNILGYIDTLNELNTDDIEIKTFALDAETELRDDKQEEKLNEKLTHEDIKKNAPKFERGAIAVPIVVE